MRDIIKDLILEFHQEPLPSFVKRKIAIPSLPDSVRKAFVFIGMRRVGKTYLMYQHMQDLLAQGLEKEKLLYLNFEDDRLAGFVLKDFQTILDVYFQLYPDFANAEDLVFYFDEIQNIDAWDKFIRRLLDKEKMQIFITGSSAKTLSKEIATSLRGRCLTQEVYPLSFSEYLSYQGMEASLRLTSKERAVVKHHSENYLHQGGFPEGLSLSPSLRNQMLQSYVNAAVFRDVIDRYALNQAHVIKSFLIQCLQNIAAPLSVTKIYRDMKSRGETLSRNNLYAYLSYFEDAYLLHAVPIFDFSARKRQVNPSKVYCADSGILYAYSMKPDTEQSASLENAVYIQFRRQGYENIFYYKTESNKEVDFVVQQENGTLNLFQVCVNLEEAKTRQREIVALIEAARELKVRQAYIISNDTSEVISEDQLEIRVVPFWEWAHAPS